MFWYSSWVIITFDDFSMIFQVGLFWHSSWIRISSFICQNAISTYFDIRAESFVDIIQLWVTYPSVPKSPWSEWSPKWLVVQVLKKKSGLSTNVAAVGHLFIASPQTLLGWFNWTSAIIFASLSSCASTKRSYVLTKIQVSRCNAWARVRYLHSKFQRNRRTSDKYECMTNTRLWWICHTSRVRICHTCEEFVRIFTHVKNLHRCNKYVRIFTRVTDSFDFQIRANLSHVWRIRTNSSFIGVTNTFDFSTRLKFDICEEFVRIKISKLVVHICHTCQNVTYSREFFTCMWQIRSVKNKVQQSSVTSRHTCQKPLKIYLV